MAERLSFDLVANDAASAGFAAAGRSAAAASDDVLALGKRLDEIGKKSAKAKVGLEGDRDADLQLDKLNLKLLKLGRTVTNPKITLDGALKASVEIKGLELEMARLNAKAASISGSGGGLSKLGALLGFGASAGGAAGQGGGGIFGGLSDAIGSPGGIAATIGVAVAAGAPLLVEVDGLVSGFAAAGAGLGAFGLLALPTFKAIAAAYTGISAAQQKYQAALAAEKQDPTKANADAVAKALDALRLAQDKMSPSTRSAVGGIQSLDDEYHRMVTAFAPDALKVFNDGLHIANELLPMVTPFATTAGNVLDGLLKKAEKFFASADFRGWLKSFEAIAGPALTAIGDDLGGLGKSVGQLFTVMSPADVVRAINIGFAAIDVALNTTHGFIRDVMFVWDTTTQDFKDSVHGFELVRDETDVVWGHMEEDVLHMALSITSTMGKLPGPLGAPFREAHTSIQHELASIEADVAAAEARIHSDWAKLHAVANITVRADGTFKVTNAAGGQVGLQGAAAGGRITAGSTDTADDVLLRVSRNETIVSAAHSRLPFMQAAFTAAGVPGYATGGVAGSYGGTVPGLAPWMGHESAAAQSMLEKLTAAATAAAIKVAQSAVSAGGAPGGAAIGAGAAAAQAYARSILHDYGWALTMFPPLQSLWNGESGWDYKAFNASSGATGIPQALPGDKMASAGADWRTNPATQIRWGLGYIKGRYGNPATAYSDWLARSPHWYDEGGYLPPGPTVAYNGTGRAEVVSTQADMKAVVEELKGLRADHKILVAEVRKVAPGVAQGVNHGLNGAARGVITR